ncbi:MAG: tRNA-intron lyase [Candidatus Heimdallarchaeota archaeon]|nr:tRNA-intron lyase [Candidatus Heimdallarchaeota archaeon]
MSNRGKIPTQLLENEALATGDQAINLYNKGYFGIPERDGVRLDGFETLHLMELGRIELYKNDQLLDIQQASEYFSSRNEEFMLRYLVYKDLRNRGSVVNVGKGSAFFFRLYNRDSNPLKGGARYYIKPLQEGGSIDLKELNILTEIAAQSSKELIMGMVDAVGDVSYLKLEELNPKAIDT